MKKVAFFLGIICIGLFFLNSNEGKKLLLYNDHDHDFEQDSEDVWWG